MFTFSILIINIILKPYITLISWQIYVLVICWKCAQAHLCGRWFKQLEYLKMTMKRSFLKMGAIRNRYQSYGFIISQLHVELSTCNWDICTLPYKNTRCSIACYRCVFLMIFHPITCLYFSLQTCENPVAGLSYRIVAGHLFACGIVYLWH